jgi:signal peptidase
MLDKTLKIIYYAVFAVIVLAAALLIVSSFPLKGNIKLLVVESGSMQPTIKTGSVIIVKPVSHYTIGDIISFGPVTKVSPAITHRIVEMRLQTGQPVYQTRGDANNAPDIHEVPERDVLGKVVFKVPYVGYFINLLKQPFGFMLIIVLPAVILVYEELKKIIAELRKSKATKIDES